MTQEQELREFVKSKINSRKSKRDDATRLLEISKQYPYMFYNFSQYQSYEVDPVLDYVYNTPISKSIFLSDHAHIEFIEDNICLYKIYLYIDNNKYELGCLTSENGTVIFNTPHSHLTAMNQSIDNIANILECWYNIEKLALPNSQYSWKDIAREILILSYSIETRTQEIPNE